MHNENDVYKLLTSGLHKTIIAQQKGTVIVVP